MIHSTQEPPETPDPRFPPEPLLLELIQEASVLIGLAPGLRYAGPRARAAWMTDAMSVEIDLMRMPPNPAADRVLAALRSWIGWLRI